jgi:hypothetical protein
MIAVYLRSKSISTTALSLRNSAHEGGMRGVSDQHDGLIKAPNIVLDIQVMKRGIASGSHIDEFVEPTYVCGRNRAGSIMETN